MIQNLPEDFLYERLPEGLVELDERGLIQAVVGGYQDRIEDLRSYSRKLELLFQTEGLPETGNNVVFADIESDQGKVYTRSLDIDTDTPPDGTAALTTWALAQMDIAAIKVTNVRYGRDLLRLVDANTIDYLAQTIGAVLFQSSALTPAEQSVANHQLLQTYFPRLKIKGTAESFAVLGRILGFDDVKVTPLYGRLSPRIPNDIGNPLNDQDFNSVPEYTPQQAIDDFYNPLKTNDGPYFSWSGTVSPGTGATDFATQVVNDKNPWIEVSILRVNYGTVTYPPAGSYVLGSSGSNSVGGPHKRAYVEAGDVLFEAIGEGQYFNGIEVHVVDSGTNKVLTITDRLSAIKYRSSYFDLAMTAEFDRVEEIYGASAMRRNKDLAANPTLTGDGTAVSPYRPWWSGSISTGSISQDFLVMTGTDAPTTIVPRVQSTGTDRQLNVDEFVSAGVQVVQALEEVRAATRLPRKAGVGFLIRDDVGYAPYGKESVLFTTSGGSNYSGSNAGNPLSPYYAIIALQEGTNERLYAESVTDPLNPQGYLYRAPHFSGSFDFTNGAFNFAFDVATSGTNVVAIWKVTSTEVIRPEPTNGTEKTYQARPEDQENGYADEVADDFPWRRDLVLGGEVVDLTMYNPLVPELSVKPVATTMVIPGHDGADYDVFGINSPSGIPRLVQATRTIGTSYTQGMPAVAYQGTLKDLASVSQAHGLTDLERLFNTGAKLFNVGYVQGVLVADPNKFYSAAHRQNLIAWFPFDEHVDSGLAPVDHSASAANLFPVGLSNDSRVWDGTRGWYLQANAGATMTSDKLRFVGDDFSMSFWFKAGTEVGDVLSYGPLRVAWNGASLIFYNGVAEIGSVFIASEFSFVSFVMTSEDVILGYGTLDTSLITWHVPGAYVGFGELDSLLWLGGLNCGMSDLRMWNAAKTPAELDTIRNYQPLDTQTAYQVGSFLSLNRRDRYALKVLPTGLVAAALLPGWYSLPHLGAVTRYNSLGLYDGESRFNEVGLGGGQIPPAHLTLGQQFYELSATGDMVVSNTTGNEPGYTSAWGSNVPTFLRVIQTGSTSYDTYVSTGTASPWPNPMVATNPANDAVWVVGDDGYVYEVSLESSGTGARLIAELIARQRTDAELALTDFGTEYWDVLRYSEQPTGAQSVLAHSSKRLAVAWGGTNVYQKADASGLDTGPLFFNLNSRIAVNVPNAFDAWTDPSVFGSALTPPTAALQENGELVFESTGQITPGNYRITIVSGNLGKVDSDFDGFAVDITVDATVIQQRLCSGLTGYNFTGTDAFDFAIENGVSGAFLTSFQWTNSFRDPSRGEARQLAIYSFKLERLTTELYKVDLAPAGTELAITLQDTGAYNGTVSGGWLASMNSYGSVAAWNHETSIYPGDDTLTSKFPLSEILNVSTPERREDILGPTNVVLVDSTTGTMPSFGTIADAATGIIPVWLWSGGVTGNSAVIAAKLPMNSPAVQVVVSEYGTIGNDAVWSNFAEATTDKANTVKVPVTGLQPNKTYYYAVATGGSIATSFVGKFKTWDESTLSFQFALASCANNTISAGVNPVVFDTIRAKDPLFFLHMGDMHYNDGGNEPTNVLSYHNCYDKVFQLSARQKQFWQNMAVPYMWDDHDYGPNNSDGTWVGRNAAVQAYREIVPHYPTPAGDGTTPLYHSFSVGRCKFIVTDLRSMSSPAANTDNASKSMMGTAQKAWFKQQLLDGKNNYAVTFWVSTLVWTGAAGGNAETWSVYNTERQEIVAFIAANDIHSLFIVSGDAHSCAFDDGTNSPGGVKLLQAAPLNQSASRKGTPFSTGPFPGSGSALKNQYGLITVVDNGTGTPFLTFQAFDDTTSSDTLLFTTTSYGTQSPV